MMKKKHTWVIALFFFAFSSAFSQLLPLQYLNTSDGLVQSQVNCVVQDNSGYLWIGTLAGISKFDGKRFTSYTQNEGLAEDWVTSLCSDSLGNVWAGHWNGGVTKYIASQGYFKAFDLGEKSQTSSITSIIYDGGGYVWFATAEKGLFRINIETNAVTEFNTSNGLHSNVISKLIRSGKLIFAFGENGYSVVNCSTLKVIEVETNNDLLNNISAVAFVDDFLMLGTEKGSLIKVTRFTQKEKRKFISLGQVTGSKITSLLHYVSEKRLYIGTEEEGVIILRTANSNGFEFDSRVDFNGGLSHNKVNCLHTGREKNVWIGTNVGLNQYRPGGFLTIDESLGLADNIVWCLDVNKNNVFAGTNSGLTVVNTLTHKITNVVSRNEPVVALDASDENMVCYITSSGNIFELNKMSGKVSLFMNTNLDEARYYSLLIDKNNLWIGSNEGALKINRLNKQVSVLTEKNGLTSDLVYKIYKDNGGSIWFLCMGGSPVKYQGNRLKPITNEMLNGKLFFSICSNKKNEIYLGAYSGGIYKIVNETCSYFPLKDEQFNYTAVALTSDEENIWIGTNRGLGYFKPADKQFVHLDASDGFKGVECNAGALSFSKGKVWLGSILGLVSFDVNYLNKMTTPADVVLKNIEINGRVDALMENAKYTYDQNNIVFNCQAVSLTFPQKLSYRYRMKGISDKWKYTSLQEVVFNNLRPDSYTFEIQATVDGMHWSKNTTVYSFEITPPFYKTWWFVVLLFVAIGFAFKFIAGHRTKQLILDKIELESQLISVNEELKETQTEVRRLNYEKNNKH